MSGGPSERIGAMEKQEKQVRAAVIGCGAIYTMHADALSADPRVRIAAFADTELSRAQAAARQYGGEAYTDYRQMIDEQKPEVVHICTPHYLHAPMAIYAMEQGCDVFCEKPMGITVAEAEAMEAAAERTGRRLGLCFQNRFRFCARTAMDKLRSGELGRVLGAKAVLTWDRGMDYYRTGPWRGLWKTEGGGVLINQSIHTLDLLDQFCGGFSSVQAHVARYMLQPPYEVEDTAMANFKMARGGNAVFFATNCYAASTMPELSVVCERGSFTMGETLRIDYADGHSEVYSDPTRETNGKRDWGRCHLDAIRCFYDCRETGKPFPIGPDQGKRTIRLIEAIYRSSETGREAALEE